MDLPAGKVLGGMSAVAAIVLAACGLFLIFLDINPAVDEAGSVRRRLAAIWRALAAMPAAAAPRAAIGAAVGAVDQFVVYWFEQSAKNVATSGAFTLIVMIAIPLAALLNWLRGGSPLLIVFILACVAGFASLAVLAEMNRGRRAAAILAPVLFAAIFLFVPGYVFVSLTDRTLNTPIGHAALTSVLIVPLLYLVCHSAVMIGAGAGGVPVPSARAGSVRHLATLGAAALPFAYLGVFACLLVGHVAAPHANVPSRWSALLVAMAVGAVSAAVTIHLVHGRRPLAGLGLASLVAAAMAAVVAIAASHWLIAVPLAAPAALWGVAALALLAKAVLALLAPTIRAEGVGERPYLAAGIMILIIAAGAGWAAAGL
jgi:hypothetical protein